jgi:DNA-binding LacI/PurR family transcriptional regulator
VAVIISSLTNLYYPEVLAQLSRRFSDRGIRVLLFALESESAIDKALSQIWQHQVDGVIAAAQLTSEQVAEFRNREIPLLFYNRYLNSQAASAVCCDQRDGASQLVDGLVKAGIRSFGIIGGPQDSVVGVEREDAAIASLKKAGIKDVTRVRGNYSYESGTQCVIDIEQERGSIPEAIIAVNDTMAIGAMDALRWEFELKIPDDVSVVGFDGVGPASWASYDLTTVRQPVGRMTESAVAMLIERIENPEFANEKRVFSGTLIKGTSARFEE